MQQFAPQGKSDTEGASLCRACKRSLVQNNSGPFCNLFILTLKISILPSKSKRRSLSEVFCVSKADFKHLPYRVMTAIQELRNAKNKMPLFQTACCVWSLCVTGQTKKVEDDRSV